LEIDQNSLKRSFRAITLKVNRGATSLMLGYILATTELQDNRFSTLECSSP